MAAKYCPRWLFNLCASMTAYEFIIGDMPIKSYAKKYSGGLSEHYGEIKHEEIENTAEVMLRFLVDINAENSDELLNAFVYFNLKYHSEFHHYAHLIMEARYLLSCPFFCLY